MFAVAFHAESLINTRVLGTVLSCLDLYSNLLTGLLTFILSFFPMCPPDSGQSNFFQISISLTST